MNVRWTTKAGDDGCEIDTLGEPEPRPYTSKVSYALYGKQIRLLTRLSLEISRTHASQLTLRLLDTVAMPLGGQR